MITDGRSTAHALELENVMLLRAIGSVSMRHPAHPRVADSQDIAIRTYCSTESRNAMNSREPIEN